MDRGAWGATAHGITKSWTQLKQLKLSMAQHMLKNKSGDLLVILALSIKIVIFTF